MQLYPGIAPLTVSTSGAADGIIVTSGASDAHGWWPGPLVAQGNDPRSAANLMAAAEANTDRLNWLGWRALDVVGGGTYAWTAGLTLSNIFVFNGDVSLLGPSNNVAGNAVLNIGLMVLGSPTVGTLQFNGDTASFITGIVGSNGFTITSTTTNTAALTLNGNGTGPALNAIASGSPDAPSVLCTGGGITFQSYPIAEADLLPANTFAQAHFARCHGVLRTDGAGGIGSTGQGINILSFGISGQFVLVTLATSMVNASFAVVGTFQTTSGTPNFTTTGAYPLVRDGVLGGTTAFFLGAWNGSSQINLATTAGDLEFAVFSRQ